MLSGRPKVGQALQFHIYLPNRCLPDLFPKIDAEKQMAGSSNFPFGRFKRCMRHLAIIITIYINITLFVNKASTMLLSCF